jgi:hypothetical protein
LPASTPRPYFSACLATCGVSPAPTLKGLTPQPNTGMFHCDDDDKRSYAAAAHRATRPGATLLISCFSDANPVDQEWPRPEASEQTLRDVLGGAGWDIQSVEPTTFRREQDGNEIEMAFWYVRAQRA